MGYHFYVMPDERFGFRKGGTLGFLKQDALSAQERQLRENIERGHGLHASSRVLVALVEKGGLSREQAYAIVRGMIPAPPVEQTDANKTPEAVDVR